MAPPNLPRRSIQALEASTRRRETCSYSRSGSVVTPKAATSRDRAPFAPRVVAVPDGSGNRRPGGLRLSVNRHERAKLAMCVGPFADEDSAREVSALFYLFPDDDPMSCASQVGLDADFARRLRAGEAPDGFRGICGPPTCGGRECALWKDDESAGVRTEIRFRAGQSAQPTLLCTRSPLE